MSLLFTEFTKKKLFLTEIVHVQLTTDSAVIPFYRLTERLKSKYLRYYETMFKVKGLQ
jgi:hypothetical protein